MPKESIAQMTDAREDKQTRLRVELAQALYAAVKDDGDPAFDRLSAWEQRAWLDDARAAQRRADPIVRQVAAELAAQCYATIQGWTWPELDGCLPADVTPTAERIELHRIEVRQKIRFTARQMVHEYDAHLERGGVDGQPEREDAIASDVKRQRDADAARRLILKPKPNLHSVMQYVIDAHFPALNGGR